MRRVLLAVLCVAAVAVGGAALSDRDSPAPSAGPSLVAPVPLSPPSTVLPDGFDTARPVAHRIELFAHPGDARPLLALGDPTPEDYPLLLSVIGRQGTGWLQVRYAQRPNGSTAWVRATDVQLGRVDNRVQVQIGARRLLVFKGHSGQELFSAPVAVGSAATPTPTGEFYVDVIVEVDHPSGPYGPYQFSVSGFSEVLRSFGGGQGQIALHGTNRPDLIGQAISNGCVRLANADLVTLLTHVRAGSPVEIVP